MRRKPEPHTALARILGWLLPREGKEHVLDEVGELYRQRLDRVGPLRADLWYVRQIGSFAWRLGMEAAREGLRTFGVLGLDLGADLSRSLRRLSRRPGYLLATVLTLGLGIGGVATAYSGANWVLLRPPPGVDAPGELVLIQVEYLDRGVATPIVHEDLRSLREGAASLRGLTAVLPEDANLSRAGGGGARRARIDLVTPEFFDVLGVRPHIGRFIRPGDHRGIDGPAELVVSHSLWMEYWDGDPAALGSDVLVNGRPVTLVGVAPPGFRGDQIPSDTEAWLPSSSVEVLRRDRDGASALTEARGLWRRMVGRLAPGSTLERLQDEVHRVADDIKRSRGRRSSFIIPEEMDFQVHPKIGLPPGARPEVRRTMSIVGWAALLLLLLSMANVTNLGLARAASRRGEAAVRQALGAGRVRVAREPLLEGVVVGSTGGIVGVLIGWGSVRLLRDTAYSLQGASLAQMTLDGRVVAFTLTVALFAGVLSAVVPAHLAGKGAVTSRLYGLRHGRRRASLTRDALVVVQVAISGTLLVGAGLFTKTLANLRTLELGLDAERIASFSVDPAVHGFDALEAEELRRRLEEALEGRAEIEEVAFVDPAALRGWAAFNKLYSAAPAAGEQGISAAEFSVTPDAFATLGIRRLAGSSVPPPRLEPSGDDAEIPELVLSHAAAKALFPEASPTEAVGRTIRVGWSPEPARIAGVVEDSRIEDVIPEPGPVIFGRWRRVTGVLTAYVRSRGTPAEALPGIRSTVQSVAPELPVFDLLSGPEIVGKRLAERRLLARLGVALALVGLVLAATGLYGVLTYAVVERTREIGIRSALGAQPAQLLGRVVGRGLLLTVAGAGVGLAGSAYAGRLVESRLFGVTALDPATYGLGVALLVLVAALASWMPGRRATRVPPGEALRPEGR